jgi:C4-dicarboxylate-specific signal transduction histidine kinase
VKLELELTLEDGVRVCGEQTMFEQVIVNLLINARDAFEAVREKVEPAVSVRSTLAEGGSVRIEVTDNAGGIREDILGRLFEPFTTSKPVDKGTGLGLSLARTVVRDMGGSIAAANADGGARFTIVLPVAAGPKAETPPDLAVEAAA